MPKKQIHYMIIGNGDTGNNAAATIRKDDPDAFITIVSAQPTHYVDHSLLASFLLDKQDIKKLYVHPYTWYSENRVNLRLNQPVIRVDPQKREIMLAHNEIIHYDKLLIASGAKPKLPEPLSRYENMLTRFCTPVDLLKMRERLDVLKHVTMIGGDCIALHLAGSLLKLGKSITFILNEYYFWPMEFDESVKQRLIDSLIKKGVNVISEDITMEIKSGEKGIDVHTKSGKIIKTDMACLTSGMIPSIDFLRDSGIDVQTGILVDQYMHTSVEDIWAAGECATVYYPELKDYRQTTGQINAQYLGVVAARNMLGEHKTVNLQEPGKITIAGEDFITYGWKGFSIDI